jgi:cobalt-zinc-cadmium efflux system protein
MRGPGRSHAHGAAHALEGAARDSAREPARQGRGAGEGPGRAAGLRALKLTLGLTAAFTIAEVVGGLIAGSLALLADAGHMLSDDLSLGLALFAAWIARRPAGPSRTFGYRRAEILAALANGVTLVAISIWIFIEAGQRFGAPPEVEGGLMLGIAVAGLAVNLLAALILRAHSRRSLNVSAAFRHVLADLLGSAGVILAATIILTTGWQYADPVASVVIAALILASSWSILRDATQILLEGSPTGTDVEEVGRAMTTMPGVRQVHDLHVWTITSGFPALAAHVLVDREADCHAARRELERMLGSRFGLEHTTLQVDHEGGELLQIEPAPDPGAKARG